MDALIGSGLTLQEILVAGRRVNGPAFSPHITLKALAYFGDGDLPLAPTEVRRRLETAVRGVDLEALDLAISELGE